MEKQLAIKYEIYAGLEELTASDKALCVAAEEALLSSFSPFSKFKVGTAISLNSGEVVLGSNQENVAYPSGLCAERVALFHIGSSKPQAVIESMAITAETEQFDIKSPVTSCGACLQVMIEMEKRQGSPIAVLFYCKGGEVLKVNSIQSLLPFAFAEDRLGSQ